MMNEKDFFAAVDAKERGLEIQAAVPALTRKMYTWMTFALAITGLTAYGVSQSLGLLQMIYGSKLVFFGLIIAEFALVIYTTARLHKLSLATATSLFILYSVLNGVTLSSIFVIFSIRSIGTAFLVTAGTFGAMALVGYTTKRDLSKMGSILMMAVVGLIIAVLVNFFLKSSMLDLVVSGIGVLVFTALTAYDTWQMKRQFMIAGDLSEDSQKVALIGALNLYLDFINLFLYLLRIFGRDN